MNKPISLFNTTTSRPRRPNDKKFKIYCNNCGNSGHIYKKCMYPITSFGVICINSLDVDKMKVLAIRRRFSFNFVEFIVGKYKLNDIDYIVNLFNHMANDEVEMIKNEEFHDLWVKLWDSNRFEKSDHKSDYKRGNMKFKLIKNGYYINNDKGKYIDLSMIIDMKTTSYKSPEWGFPKGKRNIHESNRKCAKREFIEETNIKYNEFKIIDTLKTYSTLHEGSNGKSYKTVYYIGLYSGEHSDDIAEQTFNQYQKTEISKIEWYDLDEIKDKFRDYEEYKYDVLVQVKNDLVEYLKNKIERND